MIGTLVPVGTTRIYPCSTLPSFLDVPSSDDAPDVVLEDVSAEVEEESVGVADSDEVDESVVAEEEEEEEVEEVEDSVEDAEDSEDVLVSETGVSF